MKIIDAVWEERNLGVTSAEIIIEKDDTPEYVSEQLAGISSGYSVVKVPSGMSHLLKTVQENGYVFIEDMIHVEHNLREVEMSRVLKRLYESTSYRSMTDADFEQLRTEIEKGMFDNDRISNDSYFPSGTSAKRYLNWTNDLRARGALFYVITYGSENVGFVVLDKKDEKTYYSVLGGGYEKFRRSGTGIIQKEPEITRKLGGKRLVTSVSSNNVGQLKALIMNGYRPYAIDHVLVKHRMG
ncbi:MAG: hypothetical protein K5884_11735 [Ruminococcus sp.]|nr:hypothetical protein [Ruminococcus sp.]